jgi:(2Fe-2S) ferredoxin
MLGGTMTEARARQLLLTWYRKWSPAEWDAFVRATLSADEKVQHRRPRGRAA